MKKIILPAIVAVSIMSCSNGDSSADVTLTNEIDSVSYALGANMANNIAKDFSEANSEAFIKGFKDVLDSAEMVIPIEELQTVLQPFFQRKQQEAMIKQQEEAEKAANEQFGDVKVQGEKFLEENKTKPGVKVTASGLQYIVMKEGKGKQPTAESNVEVHYHGTLMDGSVFESTVEKGKSIEFNVSQVIPGWTEGLQLMKEGAKFKFFIPQELAYGANPRPGGPIKPFMPLVFEVELIKVK
ncbi:MAG: FKBP-type peptidyl-prolyl cis-trans isomerase [Flavobacteriales bacterium]|nr:FKBP-type peptidyl-prolyl cis-trans isomerase [Flavobacteriales bacterium]